MLPKSRFKFPVFAPEIEPEKEVKFKVIATFWEILATNTPAAAVETI